MAGAPGLGRGARLIPEPPSTYYYRQMYCCFFRDKHGIASLDVVGRDNATFETDYPHVDSTFPRTKEVALDHVRDLDDETVYKLMRGNAIRMLGLDLDRDLDRDLGFRRNPAPGPAPREGR